MQLVMKYCEIYYTLFSKCSASFAKWAVSENAIRVTSSGQRAETADLRGWLSMTAENNILRSPYGQDSFACMQ